MIPHQLAYFPYSTQSFAYSLSATLAPSLQSFDNWILPAWFLKRLAPSKSLHECPLKSVWTDHSIKVGPTILQSRRAVTLSYHPFFIKAFLMFKMILFICLLLHFLSPQQIKFFGWRDTSVLLTSVPASQREKKQLWLLFLLTVHFVVILISNRERQRAVYYWSEI